MNKANLKSYAPQARKDFIAAVTARANQLGLSNNAGALEIAPAQTQGDITVIAGQAWPAKIKGQRDKLIERMQKDGFDYTLEAVAYTWFNRFAALRYMEIHDYLGHGHRALSSTAGGLPDILAYATDLASELPGLNAAKVIELKLAGNRDGELYRMLLVAQCNALSRAMPFLFERIDDDSELLLPDNLLRSDSVIAKLVAEIPEDDWAEVEIIGWLYQFYISEKKDQVIGKVVKSKDIPAATQLFTPNWIVQYLVQNSVGRLWLMANPQSTLAKEWPYYITPAEQTPEVQAQLDTLIQTRVRQDGDTLNPESITVLDPACGSGHILVVAYDVLKAIYLERGYQPRTIPRLILEKNLFGLDIDDRAAQMAGFALLMKARADDRRMFTATDEAGNLQPPTLNVLAMQSSEGMNAQALTQALQPDRHSSNGGNPVVSDFARDDLFPGTHRQMTLSESAQSSATRAGQTKTANSGIESAIASLIETFVHAKTFGSLIQISPQRSSNLRELLLIVKQAKQSGDLYAQAAAQDLLPLLLQAQVLAMQFDSVVANPPYLGGKGMNPTLKDYAKIAHPDTKSDLFAMFMERGFEWCKPIGFNSMVTMQSWMFLSSYEEMRHKLIQTKCFFNFVHIGYNSFPELNSKIAQACAFCICANNVDGFFGSYINLNSAEPSANKQLVFESRTDELVFTKNQSDFYKIPGSPITYWVDDIVRNSFTENQSLVEFVDVRQGLATSNNAKFVRFWFEIPIGAIGLNMANSSEALESKKKWFPFNKGGGTRKWFGNLEHVVDWENDGERIKSNILTQYPYLKTPEFVAKNPQFYFKESASWTAISWEFSCRYYPRGVIFSHAGMAAFSEKISIFSILAYLNSSVAAYLIAAISPTLNFSAGEIAKLPFTVSGLEEISLIGEQCVNLAKSDWDKYEISMDFCKNSIASNPGSSLENGWLNSRLEKDQMRESMRANEILLNEKVLNIYDLHDTISPDVSIDQITLASADREKDCQRLISYAIGCMMGRYSLDEPGLIYAHAGNVGFEPDRYKSFPADADCIVPITDELWFDDEASSRIREFLIAVWGADTLEENMAWLAESLGTKSNETPDETIRRYVADKFFKDHLQAYNKRPIYWLFSSGKQGAFQALVYLHRYSEGTLARLRAEYVVPLTSKIQNRIEMLVKDAAAASSTAARNKLNKEVESLKKKHVELLAYDEKLRHYADMRITLDLDDGVKVNYGKFGDLLAEVKAVTGGASDD